MADDFQHDDDEELTISEEQGEAAARDEEEEVRPALRLDIQITKKSACERHITLTIDRADIERYFEEEVAELAPTAQVPGFRPGRAPKKLIAQRYRKDLKERVKSRLLIDSISQLHEQGKLAAIGEPELDLQSVEVPDKGPMTFEFDLEVRPEFDLPRWKGLCIEKPVRAITSTDVNRCLQKILADRGRLVPHDGPAELGDYLNVNLRVEHAGRTLAIAREELIRLRPTLSFRDGKLEGFNRLMAGVRAGETRQTEVTVTLDAPNVALRGQVVTVIFEVLEVKKVELADLTPELLRELGNFNSEAELRDVLVDALEEQLRYEQRRRARRQITATLTDAADWELPPALLERQSRRELERAVMELERSGFSPEEIRAHMNVLRQNSRAATAQALKEHFILEKIAEEEKIDASEEDYEEEIAALAQQTGQTPRRIRARLEKTNSFDVLRNQIIERKVIDRILEHAEFVEVPYEFPELDVEAIDRALGGEQAEIPAAKPGGGEAAAGGHPQPQRIRG